ncbi:hypothetical protein Prudu_005902 [Prunus dulcis]|uniref:Uncharacterized protein n=1 Tax=Prunus dulcis TaxID=3755 RepID=A0A4Y1QYJ0_PRUDU|nr:hypothetical protein Prudu_005902 [Prunus dulcis]
MKKVVGKVHFLSSRCIFPSIIRGILWMVNGLCLHVCEKWEKEGILHPNAIGLEHKIKAMLLEEIPRSPESPGISKTTDVPTKKFHAFGWD